MTPTAPQRRWLLLLAPALVALPAGCGLGDYEAKMLEQQKLLERFERENKDLTNPVDVPGGEPLQPDVFVRPPKGITGKPIEEEKGKFYRYEGSSSGPFVNFYLAWAGKDGKEEFRKRVFDRFGQGKMGQVTTAPVGRAPLTLEENMVSRGSRVYYAYFAPGDQVVLAYEVTAAQANQAAYNAVVASLNTLAIGPDASKARVEYNKRIQKRK